MVIEDAAWWTIAPQDGLLCLTCMTRRLVAARIDLVEAVIRSGPYRMQERGVAAACSRPLWRWNWHRARHAARERRNGWNT